MTDKKTKKTEKMQEKKEGTEKIVATSCKDVDCPFHGSLKFRGRAFEGVVTTKSFKRIAIEFERMVYVRKYERYSKSKTKIHARLPRCLDNEINIGDVVRVQECRPLSKIIHFVVVKKIKGREEGK